MPLEFWNTAAAIGTFVVITATAIAAIYQLRHARGSNQIAALNELLLKWDSPEFNAAQNVLYKKLAEKMTDPVFRYQVANTGARTSEHATILKSISLVGNGYERAGLYVSTGLLDPGLMPSVWGNRILRDWETLAPVTAILRRPYGNGLWENFEYLAVLSQKWLAAHPHGTYPSNVPRFDLKDEWLEADARHGASQTSTNHSATASSTESTASRQ